MLYLNLCLEARNMHSGQLSGRYGDLIAADSWASVFTAGVFHVHRMFQ